MGNEIFEVKVSLHYRDLDWIAKPFKYYFDPLNRYSISVSLEQFPTEDIERIKVSLDNEIMRGKEVYRWLIETKQKLLHSNVEGVIDIHFKAVFIDGPIY